jgi:hypothetical protein
VCVYLVIVHCIASAAGHIVDDPLGYERQKTLHVPYGRLCEYQGYWKESFAVTEGKWCI